MFAQLRFALLAILAFQLCPLALAVDAPAGTVTQFDAPRIEFPVDGAKAFVILPTTPASDGSHPWVWYAPTFIDRHPDDSHAWMAKQLLAAGFAIAGVEVGESYGSPDGVKIYSALYEHLRKTYQLDAKPILLPQSRGGLMLLNWAVNNPERVGAIAGIYTVCNIESYPGVDKACEAYKLDAASLQARLNEFNPVENLVPLAKAKVPMLFIHGDTDTVVPIEKNAGLYVERCQALGGQAEIIVVPGKGHEVCPEFFQSKPFTDFILRRGAKP